MRREKFAPSIRPGEKKPRARQHRVYQPAAQDRKRQRMKSGADSGEGRIRGLLTALWEKGKALFHFLAALPEKIRQCRERVLGFFRKLKEIGSQ